MKVCGGVDVWSHIFLTSALVGGKWSTSRPSRFIPAKRALGTHRLGGWLVPSVGLDNVEKRKFFTLQGLKLVQPVASRYTDGASPTTTCK
jgi:hypothetical protein